MIAGVSHVATGLGKVAKCYGHTSLVIFGRCKFDRVPDFRDLFRWMPPKCMADFQTVTTAHKIITHNEPEALVALFTTKKGHAREVLLPGSPLPPPTLGARNRQDDGSATGPRH